MLVLSVLLLLLNSETTIFCAGKLSRADFPPSPAFVFGSGTSAYQRGAADVDGRTPSIWDTFTHAGNMHGAKGDIACDGYHKYKEDVQLMVQTGLEAYRFSISWLRLIPNGRGPVNPMGLQFYNNFIDELISHGIQPHVTLNHADLPQGLEDKYGGWLSGRIVKDYTVYADVCFRVFGDRVSHWTTLNEPNIFIQAGCDLGFLPPQRCSPPFGLANCSRGNSSYEPYIAAHHMLLAHASAAKLYKEKYQEKQRGLIGINIFAYWFHPLTNMTEDIIATQRAKDFFIGWFVNPLVFGDYPDVMKKIVGSRLPAFTSRESDLVRGSSDFFGLNHYITTYVKDNSINLESDQRDYSNDTAVQLILTNLGAPEFQFPIRPWGLEGILDYFKQVYGNPPIYIHENGQRTKRNSSLNDTSRVEFMQAYVGGLLNALRNGSNTRGYLTWSFLDVFELLDGYESGYGLYYVDMDDPDLRRHPKLSAHWYSSFLKGKTSGIVEIGKNSSVFSSCMSE